MGSLSGSWAECEQIKTGLGEALSRVRECKPGTRCCCCYPLFLYSLRWCSRPILVAGCAKLRFTSRPRPSTSDCRNSSRIRGRRSEQWLLATASCDVEQREGDRQLKASRPGAARIQVEDSGIVALLGLMRVAADDCVEAGGLWL